MVKGFMKKGIVIAGFSGIGKTELARKYSNVLDLDSASYVYDDSEILHIPFEQRKGEKRKPNTLWPNNYIEAIQDNLSKFDYVLVWDREDIINAYIKNGIDFILCYPSREALQEYPQRFRNRGNTEQYIKMKLEQYEEKMRFFAQLDVEKIILKEKETLEDYFIKAGIYLNTKF